MNIVDCHRPGNSKPPGDQPGSKSFLDPQARQLRDIVGVLFPGNLIFSRNREPRWFDYLGEAPTNSQSLSRATRRFLQNTQMRRELTQARLHLLFQADPAARIPAHQSSFQTRVSAGIDDVKQLENAN